MAEDDKNSIVELSEDVRFNGKSIKGQRIPGPGTVEFVQELRRADGRVIPVVQRIIVPADLFTKETVGIAFDADIPSIQPGNDLPIRFHITEGELYPGDQIQIAFSSQGKSDLKYFKIIAVVPPDQKEFVFPGDKTKNIDSDDCYIALNIVSSASELLDSILSSQFAIKKKNTTPPPSSSVATIDIELYSLTKNQKIQAGTKVEVKWRLEPKDLRTEMLVYSKIGKDSSPYQLMSNLGLVFDRGVFTWNISGNIPDTTEAYIKVTLPMQKIEKIFGPFLIVGGKSVRAVEEIKEEFDHIDTLLRTIRLPGKGWLSNRVSVGTYLYYLINSSELTNYVTVANRLREIQSYLETKDMEHKISVSLYGEFMTQMRELERLRSGVEGLERTKELKDRLVSLLRVFIPAINKDLLDDFKKHHGVDMKALRAEIITAKTSQGLNYLSWVMEHAQKIDQVAGTGNSYGMLDLYNYIQELQDHSNPMLAQLKSMRETVRKIKKELKLQ